MSELESVLHRKVHGAFGARPTGKGCTGSTSPAAYATVNGSESLDPTGMATRRFISGTYPSPAARQLLRQLHVDAVILRLPWLTPRQRATME